MSDREPGTSTESKLVAILSGEVDPESDEGRACLSEAGVTREQLEEMRGIVAELEGVGTYERELLEEAANTSGEGLSRGEIESVLRKLYSETPGTSRPDRGKDVAQGAGKGERPLSRDSRPEDRPTIFGRRGFVYGLGAVAAAILLSILWEGSSENGNRQGDRDGNSGGDRSPGMVLGESIELDGVQGVVSEYSALSWKMRLPLGGWFEVLVYDESQEVPAEPVARSGELFEPEWDPGIEETGSWPSAIRWEVYAYDASGLEVGRGETVVRIGKPVPEASAPNEATPGGAE